MTLKANTRNKTYCGLTRDENFIVGYIRKVTKNLNEDDDQRVLFLSHYPVHFQVDTKFWTRI